MNDDDIYTNNNYCGFCSLCNSIYGKVCKCKSKSNKNGKIKKNQNSVSSSTPKPTATAPSSASASASASVSVSASNFYVIVNENNLELLNNNKSVKSKKRKKKKIPLDLNILDILISLFIVTPLVVACWRGTWQLMDIYETYFPPWESFILGTIIHIIIGVAQESFHETLNKKHKNRLLRLLSILFMKIYTIVLNMVTNMHWRGAWIIVDQYLDITYKNTIYVIEKPVAATIFFTSCFLIMFFMKCLRNLNSPPLEICLDYGDDMFLFPNMFKVKVSEKMSLYILDVMFSIAVVTNLGVIVWRGMWLIVDLYLFPYDETLSAWASALIGYVMVAIVFILQSTMKQICDNLDGLTKLLVADTYMMFAVTGVIVVWRGIWNLLNVYFLPDYPELSCWLTHWISLIILILMGCSNSVLVRGVCLDCEEPDGTCVIFPCKYLKVIFMEEKYETWFSILAAKKRKQRSKLKANNNVINTNDNNKPVERDEERSLKINDNTINMAADGDKCEV